MAAPGGKFFIEQKLNDVAPHHESFKQLWETKWKKPCEMGVYPFMFSAIKDFEPVVEKLIEGDFKEPYNWDDYASVFFPKAEELVSEAEKAEAEGNKEKASELFLRASAIYRISRFPAPRSPKQRYAWQEGKKACIKGLGLRDHPVREIKVPHTHATSSEGSEIPIYHLPSPNASAETPSPLLIIFTGLDGYRTELAVWMEGFRQQGISTIVLEIPGTGDSPASPSDPTSPDREWSSLLDWVDAQAHLDAKNVVVWGFSTGGYYAIRIAHTHAKRLAGSVALGGGCHHMFDEKWLNNVNTLEYPFDLAHTLAHKFGYGNDLQRFISEGGKFSLLNDGTLDGGECSRLLLVNGTEDQIFPIDDYLLCLGRGRPKEARFVEGGLHMGEPQSFFICLNWVFERFGVQGNPGKLLSIIPFKPRY